jgi:hypothetical protein
MTLEEFRATLTDAAPAVQLAPLLAALWHDARGEWTRAHEIAQGIESSEAAWVHAYLHRKEGDLGNAGYWYRRAGQPVSSAPLSDEWTQIAASLLER